MNQTRKRKDFAACAARSRLKLALHAQRTAGLLHVSRSALGRDMRSVQGALARRHTDGPLWAALLKTMVMCTVWRRCTTLLGILLELFGQTPMCVCVFYYCRTYYKAVRVGEGGEWRTCAMRDEACVDESAHHALVNAPQWCTAKLGLLPGRHDAWP